MVALTLQKMDLHLPVGSLDAYIQRVNRIPILSADEEHDLALRFYQNNDLAAARSLVLSHLKFVVKIARNYRGYGIPLSDLIQEGNIGLMKAIKRFNPHLGVRLISFAVHWIKAELHEFILKNWRIVKVATTKAQRKLFFNLRQAKKRLGWFSKQEIEEVAKTLNVPPKAVIEMEARLSASDVAYDLDDEQEQEDGVFQPSKYLADCSLDPASLVELSDSQTDSHKRFYAALGRLDQRSQVILQDRWLSEKKRTLQELAAEFHVSPERIRQLEKQAMGKLKQYMHEA